MAEIELNGIVIIAGNYGSGKTETAVNLALHKKQSGLDVSIADLDLVNPYFRTREARKLLESAGVRVVLPEEKYMYADLPILTPAVGGLIRNSSDLTILDAGGDDAGVTVLAALSDMLSQQKVTMLQVVNPFRPFTENVDGCIKMMEEIQNSSKLEVTGLISNANLIDDTSPDEIYRGYDLIMEFSERSGIKVVFITAAVSIIPELDLTRVPCPILPIERRLVPPWKRSTHRSRMYGV